MGMSTDGQLRVRPMPTAGCAMSKVRRQSCQYSLIIEFNRSKDLDDTAAAPSPPPHRPFFDLSGSFKVVWMSSESYLSSFVQEYLLQFIFKSPLIMSFIFTNQASQHGFLSSYHSVFLSFSLFQILSFCHFDFLYFCLSVVYLTTLVYKFIFVQFLLLVFFSITCGTWLQPLVVLVGLRWSQMVLDHLRLHQFILGHLSYERSSSILYVGMDGWMGWDRMIIIGHRHTCKKREIVEIYLRNFFWIFRKILG